MTIDGTENLYSKEIVEKYKNLKCIEFLGLLTREEVFEYYSKVECLIFPSKLETWGLPISEFKIYNKPIILSELEYAHETVGEYEKCLFFNPNSEDELEKQMLKIINKEDKYENNKINNLNKNYKKNWKELFELLLGDQL
ncbi:glycosyltransferase [Fusobacterium varium]|uniref:glycosyltransferase n=1 Tax=Fusobacterium varium TaxID=856 RepID=UPI000316D32C|nr:glycosyltransferase [Fusobacterium varium]VEH39709.1 Glycosyl transferases group 1 [Fusobacterium varium]